MIGVMPCKGSNKLFCPYGAIEQIILSLPTFRPYGAIAQIILSLPIGRLYRAVAQIKFTLKGLCPVGATYRYKKRIDWCYAL